MSVETSAQSSGGKSPKPLGGKLWIDRVVHFCLGLVTGAGGTIAAGLATDTITPEDLPGMGGAAESTEKKAA